jgi:hypothetical protein
MTMTTNTQSNGRGIVNHAVIRVVEDATAAVTETFTVGFTPRVIRIHNLTDQISFEWFQGMADLSGLKTVAAGTRTLDLTGGPTVSTFTAGFSVPAATMVASKTFDIEVIG